jgi:hypothetical protein
MVRRVIVGTIAAAALLGVGFGGQAQAQSSCTYAGNSGCGEVRFNAAPDPRDPSPPMQIAGQAQMPPASAQTAGGAPSQASPSAEAQPAGEE